MTTIELPANRRTTTDAPITELLSERWSYRSFDPEHVVSDAEVTSLLEAARWAPSASNRQPRRFISARRGTETFEKLVGTLKDSNSLWAPRSSLLILGIAVAQGEDGTPSRFAQYDLGQSIAHLTVQAQALGLGVRQMGGFHADLATAAFDLPEHFVPHVLTAVGQYGHQRDIDDVSLAREQAPRERVSLDELVLIRD